MFQHWCNFYVNFLNFKYISLTNCEKLVTTKTLSKPKIIIEGNDGTLTELPVVEETITHFWGTPTPPLAAKDVKKVSLKVQATPENLSFLKKCNEDEDNTLDFPLEMEEAHLKNMRMTYMSKINFQNEFDRVGTVKVIFEYMNPSLN